MPHGDKPPNPVVSLDGFQSVKFDLNSLREMSLLPRAHRGDDFDGNVYADLLIFFSGLARSRDNGRSR